MGLSSNAKNAQLDHLATIATFCSIHNAIPSDAGTNEISGGSPAYARKAIGWDAASGGVMNKDATDPVFDVPAGTEAAFMGLWSALTAGVFYGFMPINGGDISGVAVTDGTADSATSRAHGLTDDDRVFLRAAHGEALPTGLDASTVYYVVSATTDTFQLSATQGGAAIDIGAGEFHFQRVTIQTYTVQGTMTVDTASIDLNA